MVGASSTLNILKGPTFADAVRSVCAQPVPVKPIEGLKYRRILAAGVLGGEKLFATLGFIAHALRSRGATVTFLQCDQTLPACVAKMVSHHESACTRWCHANAAPFAEAMNLSQRWYGEFLSAPDRAECDDIAADIAAEDIPDFAWRGVHVGPMVELSLRRYFQRGNIGLTDDSAVAKARDYLRSALYLRVISEHALDELQIEKIYMTDGVYVDWGVVRAVAGLKGIPVDFFINGLRGHSLMFLSDPAPGRTTPLASWERWRKVPLDRPQETRLDEYLARRARKPWDIYPLPGSQGGGESDGNLTRCRQAGGLVFGLFPNIGFDACVDATGAAYRKTIDWIYETVTFFLQNPQHHLIVKSHPHEAWAKRPAADRVDRLLVDRFGALPDNISLIPPESRTLASEVIDLMDVGLVYTSTVAIEAAVRGKPVLLAGGGLHARSGIVRDVTYGDDYTGLLSSICNGSAQPAVDVELARRYAYYTFFRRWLPFEYFETFDWDVTRINIKSLAELAPGRDQAVDTICNGILCDQPFEWDQ